MSYYFKFETNFPTVRHLAEASEDEVLKNWQGLGYYSRARNLHASARYIVDELGGKFPSTYSEILKLKGVGDYTASAISSFCFDEVNAVVDGNVYRVLSRVFGVHTPIDSNRGKKEFKSLAQDLIPTSDPASFNQGLMEFGATQCVPRSPNCSECVFSDSCIAFIDNLVETLPVKEKKTKQRDRFFEYLVLLTKDQTVVKQRREKGIWQNLFDFPLIENNTRKEENHVLSQIQHTIGTNFRVITVSEEVKHILSHQKLYVRFWQLEVEEFPELQKHWQVTEIDQLSQFAFPKVVDNYLSSRT